MSYTKFEYLWPPRPENAIPKNMLAFYEKRGWVAQIKMNGSCNLITVSPERALKCMTRHNTDHKLWTPTVESSAIFKTIHGSGWYVFVAELLHSKIPGIRDINYINDILVADGTRLDGMSFSDRQRILTRTFLRGGESETISHYVLDEHAWLAKNHESDFIALFDSLNKPEHEGLVLKNQKAALIRPSKQSANAGWSVKCRRPTKVYSF